MAGFKKAVKSKAKARIGLIGPSGSGKTYTALRLGTYLGGTMAVIDTEHGSASKYADEFQFDTLELDNFNPQQYINGISEAGKAGYDVLIIDSLTHAWAGTGGALEMAEQLKAKHSGNKFAAWGDVTPLHNRLIEAMLAYPGHLIVTMRSKMDYIQTQNEKGNTVIRKVGMAPVQRDGMEYEFDIVGDMDLDHNLIISKTRCRSLDGSIINRPGKDLAGAIQAWLSDGEERPPAPPPEVKPEMKPEPPVKTEPPVAAPEAKPEVKSDDPGSLVLGFGKYANKSLREILAADRGYMEWLAVNAREQSVREASGKLLSDTAQPELIAEPIQQPMLNRIHAIRNAIMMSDGDLHVIAHDKYSVTSLKELTKAQGSELIAYLEEFKQ